jgi:hypothetical protein
MAASKADAPASRSLGQIAYEAYVAEGQQDAGFAAGVRMPSWPETEGRIQGRWEAAAAAVAAHVIANPPPAGAQ